MGCEGELKVCREEAIAVPHPIRCAPFNGRVGVQRGGQPVEFCQEVGHVGGQWGNLQLLSQPLLPPPLSSRGVQQSLTPLLPLSDVDTEEEEVVELLHTAGRRGW